MIERENVDKIKERERREIEEGRRVEGGEEEEEEEEVIF